MAPTRMPAAFVIAGLLLTLAGCATSPCPTDESIRTAVSNLATRPDDSMFEPTELDVAQVQQVVRFGSAAVPMLIETMNNPAHAVRARAAMALGLIGDRRAIDVLAREARDESGYPEFCDSREQAVIALGRIGDRRAIPALTHAMQTDHWRFVRRAAAGSLAMLGGPGIAVLKGRLAGDGDLDSLSRREAVSGLGKGGPAAIPLLTSVLRSSLAADAYSVSREAAMSLCEIETPEALSALLAFPDAEYLARPTVGPWRTLPDSVMAALCRSGYSVTVAGLAKAAKDRDPAVRHLAAWALGVADPATHALPSFPVDRAHDYQEWTDLDLDEAKRCVDPESIPHLRRLLKDGSPAVRYEAARRLAWAGESAAMPVLAAALQDPAYQRTIEAYDAAHNLDPRAAMTAGLASHDPHVRDLAETFRGGQPGSRPDK